MIWFTFHSFFPLCWKSSALLAFLFFTLTNNNKSIFPSTIINNINFPCLSTSVDGHGIALTPWRLASTIIIIITLLILSPSSFLLSLYILFFLLFILRAGWNQPCAIGKALVRAPMVLERPLKLYFFPISSSLGTEALHLTLLHPLPPYVACKAPGTALAQPAVWRTTLWPPPLLLYSTSHNIYIYTFFQSLVFLYLAFIYSVFLYYVFFIRICHLFIYLIPCSWWRRVYRTVAFVLYF